LANAGELPLALPIYLPRSPYRQAAGHRDSGFDLLSSGPSRHGTLVFFAPQRLSGGQL
jgi:hypothetical protein